MTFDAQGGTFPNGGSTTQTMNLEYDRSYSVPQQNPTKSGYVFEGWYTQKTDGTQVTSLTLMSTPQNHTLYARWRKIEKTTVTVGGVTLTYEGAPVYAKTDSEGKVNFIPLIEGVWKLKVIHKEPFEDQKVCQQSANYATLILPVGKARAKLPPKPEHHHH